AEDGIRDFHVTGVQTCALPICALYREQTFAHEHNLAITGGSENIQYYISGQYLDQDGLMVFNQDNYKRYSFNGKVNGKLADWARSEERRVGKEGRYRG